MTSPNEQILETNAAVSAPLPESRTSTSTPLPNGPAVPSQPESQSAHAEADRPAPAAVSAEGSGGQGNPSDTDRAAELVDRLSHGIGYFASLGTRKLASFLSRAREALQDFWAEVQDFRRGRKP
jgi:hypothetical protein